MASAIQLKLSPSRNVPFNRLRLCQSNVRRVNAGVSIEQRAASVVQRTLILSVNLRAIGDTEGGADLPFVARATFGEAMGKEGVAAMEVLARNLKALSRRGLTVPYARQIQAPRASTFAGAGSHLRRLSRCVHG
jgi:hypothetical protein